MAWPWKADFHTPETMMGLPSKAFAYKNMLRIDVGNADKLQEQRL